MNVVKNAKKNIAFGAVNQVVLLLCPFIVRTVIQYVLGEQYLGLNGLFSSVLSVLSLSELGFSTAIVYNMYKPIAEGDTAAVNALLNFYRKVYRIIGCVVLGIGLCLIPFLPHLIKGSYPHGLSLTGLYLIYLVNASISYFMFAYMSSLIVVHQRDDINSTRNMATKLLLTGSQIAVLLITKNYYLFTLLMPVFTVINNLWIAWVAKKQFPEFKCEGNISQEKLGEIKKLVAGTFIQKSCAVTRNSLDSICISAFLGLALTAIYDNYYQISYAITGVLGIITTSFVGGIGNHVAIKSKEENFEELKKLDFVYLMLSGWCATCLLCLYQPVMRLWMGERMLLPAPAVILLVVYFYLLKLGDMRSMYAAGSGLWWLARWRALGETALNLVLNVGLGYLFGIYGIICATIISLFLCNYLWSVKITFDNYFGFSPKRYYAYQMKYTLVNLCICGVTVFACGLIKIENSVLLLICRALVCAVMPATGYFMIYRKNELFNEAFRRLGIIKNEQD